MNLPNASTAVVTEEKVRGYLLNPLHPEGAGKALFFMSHGFHESNWQELTAALLRLAQAGTVAARVDSIHGTKYIIDGSIDTPAGRPAALRTIWIVDRGLEFPRLVTAYPTSVKG